MSTPIHAFDFRFLMLVLAGALLPVGAFAQAGLSGDPFSGQAAERGQLFDNGKLQSQSALGQLEEMTGATVDRSSDQGTGGRVAPAPQQVQPRYDPNLMIRQELAGALANALIGALFSDNSAQEQAAAEARARAEAAAQAEAFRVQQELARKARIRQAQHYRAEWDSSDQAITDQLSGAFSVAPNPGTAFFGRPANPDAAVVAEILNQNVGSVDTAPGAAPDIADSDASVVDLRGSSGVVQLLREPTPVVAHASVVQPLRSDPSTPTALQGAYELTDEDEAAPAASSTFSLGDLRAQIRARLEEKLLDEAKEKAIDLFWDLTENIPGQTTVKNLVELNGTRQEITDEMTESNEELLSGPIFGRGMDLVSAMGNPNRSGAELVARQDEEYREVSGKIIRQTGKRMFQYLRGAPVKLELGEPEAAEGGEEL